MPERFLKGKQKPTLVALIMLLPSSAWGQEQVRVVPDWVSYGTASVAPATAVWKALRSSETKCKLSQLAIAEAIGNGTTLLLKKFVMSPRPCLGCRADGFPSGHSMNSVLGMSSGWRVGLFMAVGTAELRHGAKRHTKTQVAAGLAIGGLAELAGQKLVRC